MSHSQWYRDGKITRAEFEAAEHLKKYYPSFYKVYEKRLKALIKIRQRNAKRVRKHKAVKL